MKVLPEVQRGARIFKNFAPYWRVCVRQYCAEIVKAGNRMELIVAELAKRYGATEKLKAENQTEWARQINACKAQTGVIVKFELIYD